MLHAKPKTTCFGYAWSIVLFCSDSKERVRDWEKERHIKISMAKTKGGKVKREDDVKVKVEENQGKYYTNKVILCYYYRYILKH